jgi:ATP-binding cassette subfamily F protein 3
MKYKIVNGSITLTGNTILDSINIEINETSHIGIVGSNGAGKTTLLKGIIDNSLIEEGIDDIKHEIIKMGTWHIGYQEQITFDDEDISLEDEIRKCYKDLINIEKKIKEYEENMVDISKYSDLLEHYNYLGGYTYKKEYEVILHKFGFKEDDKSRSISSFSGGERTKIAFIKLLLSKPDLLLLDEPTNHLDIDAIEWLEGYLKEYKKAFIVISHDRMFLNNVVNTIYEIRDYKTIKYSGNYEYYEKEKVLRYEQAVKEYEKQQEEIKHLREIYERFRNKPSKASLALSRLHRLEKMDIIDKPRRIDSRTIKTSLNDIPASPRVVLKLKNLSVGYNNELCNISLDIISGSKIGIIGKNGTGKSTLLKTINGMIDSLGGKIILGPNVSVGYFDQTLKMIDDNNTVINELREEYPEMLEQEARNMLAAFLFVGEDVHKKINVLSGGEKVRLQLCKIFASKPNLLILDEPTNHMDIANKEYLEELLKNYKGTLLFVSHDRYFIKKCADSLIVFDNNACTYLNYGYDKYIKNINEYKNIEEVVVKENKTKTNKVSVNNNLYELKKELKILERDIMKKEMEVTGLNSRLVQEEVYTDIEEATKISIKIKEINKELEVLNIKWEELTNRIIGDNNE